MLSVPLEFAKPTMRLAKPVCDASGRVIGSSLTVWAAGVKAADFLKGLGGDAPLETNRLNQLVVNGNLQTTLDPNIFAFGDCAACPQEGGAWVPPRAQSAYQQAMYLVRALPQGVAVRSQPG